jgi:hypothetical protein
VSEVSDDIVRLMVEIYRERGPMNRSVPVATFLATIDQSVLEQRLAGLLEAGTLVPLGRGAVALAPALRLSVIGRGALWHWLRGVDAADGELGELLLAAIRVELRSLVQWAVDGDLPIDLVQCAVELAAVLAMHDLNPAAIDVVNGFVGPPRQRLVQVLTVPEGSCRSPTQLRAALARAVTTPAAAP